MINRMDASESIGSAILWHVSNMILMLASG